MISEILYKLSLRFPSKLVPILTSIFQSPPSNNELLQSLPVTKRECILTCFMSCFSKKGDAPLPFFTTFIKTLNAVCEGARNFDDLLRFLPKQQR
eukprot:TRINITY_DN8213_c0_g1_i1.p1 TRINITY_DN8213_c0_g1~~TRINITY_DN8213_c0_g1_i1.p1  ORF type:complete len:104 (+),score=16.00 TRINITY_DN8213_c0_g1_i1:28-312(+)